MLVSAYYMRKKVRKWEKMKISLKYHLWKKKKNWSLKRGKTYWWILESIIPEIKKEIEAILPKINPLDYIEWSLRLQQYSTCA